jgi:Protein of unknown function (DUF1203)
MHFRISGLPLARFASLFGLSDAQLAAHNALRRIVDAKPGFPCRVSLQDAEPGESVLLLNYEHQSAASPYRAAHAIYVREKARETTCEIDSVPKMLSSRLLSVRAFDRSGMMVGADVAQGADLAATIRRLFEENDAAYLHVHNAKPGCYAARVDRV